MKILIISQYWHPDENIPERRWQWLTKLLVENGHSVTVIAPPPHRERANSNRHRYKQLEIGPCGERILRTQFLPLGGSLLQRAVSQASVGFFAASRAITSKEIRGKHRPDLIIGTVPALPTAPITHLVAKALRKPFIIDLRDAWPDLFRQARQWNEGVGKPSLHERVLNSGPMLVIEKLARFSMHQTFRSASGMTVTSSRLAEALNSNPRVQSETKGPKITTVRNTFPASVQERIEESVKVRDDHRLRILYAGKVGRAQKIANAIEALRICNNQGVPVEMKIVGEGAAFESARASAEDLGNVVTFHDRVPLDNMKDLYEWADTCLVHLTSWEPFERTVPSKTYEIMELGKHISGCVTGEAAEIINSTGAGHTVSPENPQALADLWAKLQSNRVLLHPSPQAREWVIQDRMHGSSTRFLELVQSMTDAT